MSTSCVDSSLVSKVSAGQSEFWNGFFRCAQDKTGKMLWPSRFSTELVPEIQPPAYMLAEQPMATSSDTQEPPVQEEERILVGSRSDIDLNDAKALRSVTFEPQRFLVHFVLKWIQWAAREKKCVKLTGFDVVFYIDPERRNIFTPVKLKNLRSLASMPVDNMQLHQEKIKKIPHDEDLHAYAYEDFVWRIALAASRGRLPEKTDLEQKYLLRHWPSVSQLRLFPHATEIAVAWKNIPMSIHEIVALLEVPQRHIFAFFSAAQMTGYLHPIQQTQENDTKNVKGVGFWNRLWLKSRDN